MGSIPDLLSLDGDKNELAKFKLLKNVKFCDDNVNTIKCPSS